MSWTVMFYPDFEPEMEALEADVRAELLAKLQVLAQFGPGLGRPTVDTLKGSSFPNMKELRFRYNGLWRFAFAFDPQQRAIVLYGGDKEGAQQKRFYKSLISKADERFSDHLKSLPRINKR